MMHLFGNLYLKADSYSFTVCEEKTRETGNNIGSKYVDEIAHFSRFRDVLRYLNDKTISDYIQGIDRWSELSELINRVSNPDFDLPVKLLKN